LPLDAAVIRSLEASVILRGVKTTATSIGISTNSVICTLDRGTARSDIHALVSRWFEGIGGAENTAAADASLAALIGHAGEAGGGLDAPMLHKSIAAMLPLVRDVPLLQRVAGLLAAGAAGRSTTKGTTAPGARRNRQPGESEDRVDTPVGVEDFDDIASRAGSTAALLGDLYHDEDDEQGGADDGIR
jgi:hypothetical protein